MRGRNFLYGLRGIWGRTGKPEEDTLLFSGRCCVAGPSEGVLEASWKGGGNCFMMLRNLRGFHFSVENKNWTMKLVIFATIAAAVYGTDNTTNVSVKIPFFLSGP